jgi:hypothetical protein
MPSDGFDPQSFRFDGVLFQDRALIFRPIGRDEPPHVSGHATALAFGARTVQDASCFS